MAHDPSDAARQDIPFICERVSLSILDDENFVITFIPAQTRSKKKKRPERVIVDRQHIDNLVDVLTKYVDEVPNDSLIASIKAAERYKRSGNMKVYDSIDDLMESLN